MSPAVLTFLTFLAGLSLVFGIYSVLSDLFLRDRSRWSKRVDQEFRQRQRDLVQRSALFKNLGQVKGGADDDTDAGSRLTLTQRLDVLVEQSGLQLTRPRLLLIMAGMALGVGILASLPHRSPILGLSMAVVGGLIPLVYVYTKRNIRLGKMLSQLPDAFDLMARVLRAGQTMAQAMQAVADEFDAPIAAEFTYCSEQQNLGLPPEVSLRDLARRTGLLELKIFVLAVLVQQQTGGNMAEMLEKLASVVRERFRIRGKIKALTAEGRLQAAVLLILPPVMFLVLLFINPSYGQVLLGRPDLLLGVVIAEAVGAVWIRRIINFDF